MYRLLYINVGNPVISGATMIVKELLSALPNMGVQIDLIEVLFKNEDGLLGRYPELKNKVNLINIVRIPYSNNLYGRFIRRIYKKVILESKVKKLINEYDFIIGLNTPKTIRMLYLEPFITFPLYKHYLNLIRITNFIDGTAWFINSVKEYKEYKRSKLNICLGIVLSELVRAKYGIECEPLDPPGGVDLNLIESAPPYPVEFDAIHLARQGFMKGTPEVIQVMKILKKHGYNRFALIGGEDYGFNIRKYLDDKDIMYFGEIIDKKYIYSILKSSKVFPYPTHVDSFGIVIAEALACGVPVVAYDLPAIRHYYGDCEAVKLVKEGDIEGMATEALEILKNNQYYRSIAVKCASKYTWDKVALSFLKILEKFKKESS
jgi:glycosyltransferase involved in cell wall biosynthesis